MTKLIYTGIGSRETPIEIRKTMTELAQRLSKNWTLRSGYADGADKAFSDGCTGKMEIYLPWPGFNQAPKNDPSFVALDYLPISMIIAATSLSSSMHHNWSACSLGAKKMHIRNVFQVLGRDMKIQTNCVICWTKAGRGVGGTGQAIRIARKLKIPMFDLAHESALSECYTFIEQTEKTKL